MRKSAGGEQGSRHISRVGPMARIGEQLINPSQSFEVMSSHIPEPEKRSCELHGVGPVVCFQPVKRGAKIVLIGSEIIGSAGKGLEIPLHPPDRFGPDDPICRKAAEDRIFLTRLLQLFTPEILDRLQHPKSWLG